MTTRLVWPVIIAALEWEGQTYFMATIPGLPDVVAQGRTFGEALQQARQLVAGLTVSPPVDFQQDFPLAPHEQLVALVVTPQPQLPMKRVRRNISIPVDLDDWARLNRINVSRVTANALRQLQALDWKRRQGRITVLASFDVG